ncbi:RNA 3'-terminal phosphate cyclase domain-containing protein [Trichoderma chlorosporum]
MRLLNTKTLQIEQFANHGGYNTLLKKGSDLTAKSATPRYAILSHTWGDGEITFQDMQTKDRSAAMKKRGWRKLEDSSKRAARDGFQYIWIDTCCIDKTSGTELAEAINSMFQWYKESALCYAFLEDCQGLLPYRTGSSSSALPRWYTRGWTLQELIAPKVVHFYSVSWQFLGTKDDHLVELSRVTGIDTYALGGGDLSRISVARRMSWVANRQTTVAEDMAYSLLGIFNLTMPMLYGEGSKAFIRLQKEIMKGTDDQSLFVWAEEGLNGQYRTAQEGGGLLALSPAFFKGAGSVTGLSRPRMGRIHTAEAMQGIKVDVLLCRDVGCRSGDIYFAVLDCLIGRTPGVMAGIRLKKLSEEEYLRVDADQIFEFARLARDGNVDIEGFDPLKEQAELAELRSPTTSLISPGFWLLPPAGSSPKDIKIMAAHLQIFWENDGLIMQPLMAPSTSHKTGALQLRDGRLQFLLIFGQVQTPRGMKPWYFMEQDRKRSLGAMHPASTLQHRNLPFTHKRPTMPKPKHIVLDGRTGEGGGQLVRLGIALAALTSQPVEINNVRGNRPRGGGLKNQHVAAIQWLAQVTEADVEGLSVGSKAVRFTPRRPPTELFQRNISIRTESGAASTMLVLQAMLPFLLFASSDTNEPVIVELSGGTNVAFSPSYEYFDQVLAPTLEERFGVHIERGLRGRGWSLGPLSRGSIWLKLYPIPKGEKLKYVPPPPYSIPASFEVTSVDVSIITPMHSHKRLQETVVDDIGVLWPSAEINFKVVEDSCSDSRWSVLLVARSADGIRWAKDVLTSAPKNIKGYDRFIALLCKKLCKDLYEEVTLGGQVDEHLQDQLVCFQALCDGPSSFPRGDEPANESLDGSLGPLSDAMGQLNVGEGRMRREKTAEPFGHGSTHAKTARWVVGELLPRAEFYNKGDLVKGVGFCMQ